jgi:hypothetical protein
MPGIADSKEVFAESLRGDEWVEMTYIGFGVWAIDGRRAGVQICCCKPFRCSDRSFFRDDRSLPD